MEWIRVSILGNALGREVAQGLLSDLGYENLEIVEDQEAVEAVLLETSKYWDYASAQEIMGKEEPCVRVYLSKEEEGEEKLLAIREAVDRFREENPDLDLGAFSVSVQEMRDEDWANNWKQYYKPLTVGRRLAIVPEWEAYANPQGRTVVTMEPGAAFGTGQHETTLMCLELLEEMDLLGKRVLDVGCGTGILGITADKLGAREVLCVDMDPVAVSAARHNAALNGCGEELCCVEGNLADRAEGVYDVIFANIVAHVILALLPQAAPLLAEGGRMVVSGIIRDREQEILAAAKDAGLVARGRKGMGEWVALLLERA
jgi:ribosomal protein L11 methyltransferase